MTDTTDRTENDAEGLAAFRESRIEMPAHEFGELIGDAQWEGDDALFLVYDSQYWIERLEDGRHMLTIENDGGITGDGVTLEDLEERLFDWAMFKHQSQECGPALP